MERQEEQKIVDKYLLPHLEKAT